MGERSFIVQLDGAVQPLKHFASFTNAYRFARKAVDDAEVDLAKIYAIACSDTSSAVVAHERGHHELVRVVVPLATEGEVQRAKERAWEEMEKQGMDALVEWLMRDLNR